MRKFIQKFGASASLWTRTIFRRKTAREKAIRRELREVRRAQNNLPGMARLLPIAARILKILGGIIILTVAQETLFHLFGWGRPNPRPDFWSQHCILLLVGGFIGALMPWGMAKINDWSEKMDTQFTRLKNPALSEKRDALAERERRLVEAQELARAMETAARAKRKKVLESDPPEAREKDEKPALKPRRL